MTAAEVQAVQARVESQNLARRVETRVGYRTGAAVAVLVVVLGVLVWVKGSTTAFGPSDEALAWVPSALSMGFLLAALQLVASLLVHEHFMERFEGRAWWFWWAVMWVLRLTITGFVLAAVWWSTTDGAWWNWLPDHGTPGWKTASEYLLDLEVVLVTWLALQAAVVDSVSLPTVTPAAQARSLAVPDADQKSATTSREGRLVAIGASGGGIRAAAFVLGGHQAVQDKKAELKITREAEPHVFAVSGGSYMATAMALRRKYDADGKPRATADVTPWAETYTTGSAELQWLRRHTRYLFEPGSRLRDGIVTLLLGATVNIFLVSVALRFVAWLSSQLGVTLGVVDVARQSKESDLIGKGEVIGLTLKVSDVKWQLMGLPLVCLGLIGVLMLCTWWAASRFDGSGTSAEDARSRAAAVLNLAALARPALILLAGAWLLLTFLLPGATAGATKLAAANQPTVKVASALTGLGLVDEHICRSALLENLHRAEAEATQLAQINPGVEQSVKGGACGTELVIKRKVSTAGAEADADADSQTVGPDTVKAMHDYVDTTGRSTRTRIAGIGVLLTLVAGLLRRGSAAPASASGRFAAIRRRIVTWLPMAIMSVLAAYLAVLWSSGLYVHVDGPGHSSYLLVTVVLTAIASTVAFVVDANVTSMHRYYRSSLSGAFAVGVAGDGSAAVATELPPKKVYRFSELGDQPGAPRLHVVTTLNTQEPGEAPTLRRGYPMVFSGDGVSVYRYRDSTPVPMRDYEKFAGSGRVSIMATVGISGAAVSPIMGRYHEQMAPYRMLLALFNMRLGTWTRNPAHTPGPQATSRSGGGIFGFLWLTTKPGLVQMALEAAGKSSADQRWVYLSDGGHLDNTALVECVRHAGGTGRVLVLDASNDPVDSWQATGDAIAVVKADLDEDLEQVPLRTGGARELTWARRYANGSGLEVLVVKAARVEPPKLGQKPEDEDPDALGLWEQLPPNVQSFLRGHADFPRASTARQRFGDLEFEAYRAFGHTATLSALVEAGWVPAPPVA
jgi:hypothetical protein